MLFERKCIRALSGAIMIAFSAMSVGAESPSPGSTGKTLTGKERLSGKASDEQRVDNCKVPSEKRGPKPRPDSCDRDGIGR